MGYPGLSHIWGAWRPHRDSGTNIRSEDLLCAPGLGHRALHTLLHPSTAPQGELSLSTG